MPESAVWTRAAGRRTRSLLVRCGHWGLALYAMVLMACFNFFSHGTQDLYPHFLQKQHGFSTGTSR